ncbi:MAG TPA: ribonuclease PH [Clostridiales bacterium]|nr:ribonuclease PH [Clostridiales bacterium]
MNEYRNGRPLDQLRPITIETGFQKFAAASVLWRQGDTCVLSAVNIDDEVPPFLVDSGKGWLTAEYALLPASTLGRTGREAVKGKQSGRTMEIQRLIGRSLRRAVDLRAIAGKTVKIDCEVLQADGGTRTAAICSAWLCLALAVKEGKLPVKALKEEVAAVSGGIVGGEVSLDLQYSEDSRADVDMNIVMTGRGRFVEIQGTGENSDFSPEELKALLDYGKKGIEDILAIEREFLK